MEKNRKPGPTIFYGLVLLSTLCFLSLTAFSQNGAWVKKQSLGTPAPNSVSASRVITIGNKAYFFSDNQFWEFDPVAGTWTAKPLSAHMQLSPTTLFAVGTKGYIISGETKDVYEYDPNSNTYTKKGTFPGASRVGAVAFSIGGKGYMGTGQLTYYPYYGQFVKDFWEYDPVTDTWTQKKDFPGAARSSAVGFCIGTKGYVGTGYIGFDFNNQESIFGAKKDFWEYDPASDSWTEKAPFAGGPKIGAVSFCIGNLGYIGTGLDATNNQTKDFWEYNADADTWTRKEDLEGDDRFNALGFSVAGNGYIAGGVGWTYNIRRDLWKYDPTTNDWSKGVDFKTSDRGGAVGFSIGNKGYLGTGANNPEIKKDFWEYDPVTDVWSQKADFAGGAREDAVGFSIGSKGYIGTGSNYTDYVFERKKDFWEYDPATNTWTKKADFPGTARQGAVGFSIGNAGYLGLGYDGSGSSGNDFWKYNPASDTWESIADYPGAGGSNGIGFTIGSKGYAGLTGNQQIMEYDPASNSWRSITDYPGTSTVGCVAFGIGSKGYVGGTHYYNTNENEFWEFNPSTNQWFKKPGYPGQDPRNGVGFPIGNKGYMGTGGFPSQASNDFWQFDPMNNYPISNGWLMQYYSRTSCILNGWGSFDPDGGEITYSWKKTAGPNGIDVIYENSSTPILSNLPVGQYTFELSVTDAQGAVGKSYVNFDIKPNRLPIANGWLQSYYSANSVLLNAWGSYDPDGWPVTFSWKKVSGPDGCTILHANASTPVISDMQPGVYTFELTVTDNEGATATSRVEVSINNTSQVRRNDRTLNESLPGQDGLVITPNPVRGILQYNWNTGYSGSAKVIVTEVSGRIVKSMYIKKDAIPYRGRMEINNLNPGAYILSIESEKGKLHSKKFLKIE